MRASLLDRVRRDTRATVIKVVSKRKVLIGHGNLSLVLHNTDPLAEEIEQIYDAYHEKQIAEWEAAQALNAVKAASQRAKRLLHEIVREHDCLTIEDGDVIVDSANGRRYAISIKTGSTYRIGSKKRRFVCVQVPYSFPGGHVLPLADRIIAKVLTIAYAPRFINTL